MTDQREDDGVVRRAGRGDRRALDLLVDLHYAPVWRAVMRFAGDREEADTITQEAFLKAIGSLGSFRGESRFRTWIIRIALNLGLNERRRKRPAPLPSGEFPSPAPGPVREAGDREVRSIVAAAVDRLSEDLREALLLTFYGGCSHAEAGRILGCAEGTVSWRVFTAKQKLREVLPDGL